MQHIKEYLSFDKTPMLLESASNISESLQYHVSHSIPLHENIYRMGSSAYFDLFNEARDLLESGKLDVCEEDRWMLESDIGKTAVYEGEPVYLDMPMNEAEYKGREVELNKPKRGGSKKFYVYVQNDKGNVVKVSFGAEGGGSNLAVKLRDPKARANFAKRHQCETKNDKTTPGYWSCRLPRYAKQLGLSGGGKWW